MSAKHTPGPWTLFRMEGFDALHKLRGTKPEEHEGYFRTNDGSWAISNPDGRICLADFKGKAKRGEAWKAPDPEGMADARLTSRQAEGMEALKDFPMLLTPATTAWGKQVQEWQDKALAAIARAEGGQPCR